MSETEKKIEQEEEIQIEVVDDAVVEQEEQKQQTVSSDDELSEYTKGVSKRINKLNTRAREAEARAQQAEQLAQQREQRIKDLESQTQQLNTSVLSAEEQAVEAKERQANELFKKAYEANDADLISKADSLKGEIQIQKEQIRLAKNRAIQQEQVQNNQQAQPQQVEQEQVVVPTEEALLWKSKNPWYGVDSDTNDVAATQYANFTHINLINEGFEADSDEYYNELNKRVYNVYPDLMNETNAEEKEVRPTVQRVASASVGSRQKTQGNKSGITFSKSEKERVLGLKPYNMSEEDWLKQVAKQKQKIQQREAS